MIKKRRSGILLHITSLPSPYGIGDFGPGACRFIDFLAEAKQSFWQILPLTPTDPISGNSPYRGSSAFAGNLLLISPELLVRDGLLSEKEIEPINCNQGDRINYHNVITYKERILDRAYECFKREKKNKYENFCSENSSWLDDFALFLALKSHWRGKSWNEWPPEIRDREPEALRAVKRELSDRIEREKYLQFVFFEQWLSLKSYAREKGIQIIGDIPIYVHCDSVDVWTNPEIFKLDEEKKPAFVAGVPPDYFSETGQLWGDPVYQWNGLRDRGYSWWLKRVEHNLQLFDLVRIDHFRGFAAYWEIPAGEKTAVRGKWVDGPGDDFFKILVKRFPRLPIIAEDLGIITPDVRKLMNRFKLPGMRVLLFAFGDDLATNPYVPHNYIKNCVVYTGTHDNNTVKGWFEGEATQEDKGRLFRYLGREVSVEEIPWELIKLAMMSVANLAIIPMQDILGLGTEARMNRPSITEGNWEWQLLSDQLKSSVTERLREMTEIYGRTR